MRESQRLEVNKFEYLITCDGKIIAAFANEDDRNRCIDHLAEEYNDCEWEKIGGEEEDMEDAEATEVK